jgi:hypothetical protein
MAVGFFTGLVERFGALYVGLAAGALLLLVLGAFIAICRKYKTYVWIYNAKNRLT